MSRSVVALQAALDAAYTAQIKALEAEEYAFDSGQGRQSARRNLSAINKTIEILEAELADATGTGGSVFSIQAGRS